MAKPAYSVVITAYNPLSLLATSLASLLGTVGPEAEIIVVDNHSPFSGVREYLSRLSHLTDRLRVLDPGRNLGCHGGSNFGSREARGEYLVKMDDDQVPPPGVLPVMARALRENPDLAYLSLPWPPIRPEANRHGDGYSLAVDPEFVFFGVTMLSRELWAREFIFDDGRLYGFEDLYYWSRAHALGLKAGYLVSHPSRHLGRGGQDPEPLYGVYKVAYAWGLTSVDYPSWLREAVWDGALDAALLNVYPWEAVSALRERFRALQGRFQG